MKVLCETLEYKTAGDKKELTKKIDYDFLAIGHLAPSADFHYSQLQVNHYL